MQDLFLVVFFNFYLFNCIIRCAIIPLILVGFTDFTTPAIYTKQNDELSCVGQCLMTLLKCSHRFPFFFKKDNITLAPVQKLDFG